MTRTVRPPAHPRPGSEARPTPPGNLARRRAPVILALLALLLVRPGPAGAQTAGGDPCPPKPLPCPEPIADLPVPEVPVDPEDLPLPVDPGELPLPDEPPVDVVPEEPGPAPEVSGGGAAPPPAGAVGDEAPAEAPPAGAAAPVARTNGSPDPLADPAPGIAQVATEFAFPISLIVAVALFLLAQRWVDRRDPKVALAPTRPHADLLTFE